MADQRTMAQLLQAPTEGYEDAIVVPAITADNFELKHGLFTLVQNKQFFGHDKEDLHAHIRYFNKITSPLKFPNVPHTSIKLMLFPFSLEELHQLDTFYNALNSKNQDSLNSAARGNFLDKMPRECLAIIESKSKVHYSRDKPVVAKVSTTASTFGVSPDVAELKDMVKALLLDKKPVTSPISEPAITPVSASKPNPKASIPYPSRRNDERNPLIRNKEKLSEMARTLLNEHCSTVLLKKLLEKLGDPSKFLIPCDFQGMAECLALVDLGASINLMLFSMWKRLSFLDLTPTCMTLELVDRSISRSVGVAEDVYVKVGSFHFLADFVVVDFDADPRVPLILGRSFLKTRRALIDVFKGELTLRVGREAVTFNLDQTLRYSTNYSDMTAKRIDVIDMACEEYSQEVCVFLIPYRVEVPLLDEPPVAKLKVLPPHLEYAFLKGDDKLLIIIAKDLNVEEKTALLTVLKSHKRAIAWKLSDIKSINPEFCTHKILMEEDFEPTVQHQRREKTTFTCPYGTFAYRRMPFGLCNAPGMFQRCMMAIFYDMIEKTIEVFMDDFSVFGNSFQSCLFHLERMLKRCEDTNLCLNWEKSYFMVKKGIVLGHKISKQRIEVNKAKIDVISKLPHPTNIKGIRSFLGHVGFYRRFIKDFSKIARPMTRLLEKDTLFIFSPECVDAFQTLKRKLIESPILIAPD
uniref:Reverse transcriptase domain-containing protein n=1 Tax=Tanacetum cinerariifolium TaxID=118510 RepID=A0A699IXL1_TANCI|nr:hypothetical protein [Tanacetum cinerariifolium]